MGESIIQKNGDQMLVWKYEGRDVCIFETFTGCIVCEECSIVDGKNVHFKSKKRMIRHLLSHVGRGDYVDWRIFARLVSNKDDPSKKKVMKKLFRQFEKMLDEDLLI